VKGLNPNLFLVSLLVSSSFVPTQAAPPTQNKAAASKSSTAKKPAAAAHAGTAQGAKAGGSSSALNSYATQLRVKMAKTWVYPLGKNHVTLTIQVNQDGSVSNLTLDSTPKNPEAEQKANDAFNSAQPLATLPSGVTEGKVTAIFDSEADQWNTKGANLMVKVDPTKTSAPGDAGAGTPAAGDAATGAGTPATGETPAADPAAK